MSLSNDTEAKDLAISLFWTSDYVKDNEITLNLHLTVFNGRLNRITAKSIGFYVDKDNENRYHNFCRILDDLIHDNAYFVKDELK